MNRGRSIAIANMVAARNRGLSASVVTTDETETVIATLEVPYDISGIMEVDLLAITPDGLAAYLRFLVAYKNYEGEVTINNVQGLLDVRNAGLDTIGYTVTDLVSAMVIKVTGMAATTIKFKVVISKSELLNDLTIVT